MNIDPCQARRQKFMQGRSFNFLDPQWHMLSPGFSEKEGFPVKKKKKKKSLQTHKGWG